MHINVNNFMKVNYKPKGNIDINKSTFESLKELEKRGVQINLFIAGLLDNFDYKKVIDELDEGSNKKEDILVEKEQDLKDKNGGIIDV